jgi:hypothetical protein
MPCTGAGQSYVTSAKAESISHLKYRPLDLKADIPGARVMPIKDLSGRRPYYRPLFGPETMRLHNHAAGR